MMERAFRAFGWYVPAILVFLLVMLQPNVSNAQLEGSTWYFGRNAGVSFASNPPSILFDGEINTLEGCASLSDENGELLFYTDGVTVWNKDHQVMPNGTGLKGDSRATQSGLIVPWPGEDNKFYVFTVDCYENNLVAGLNYSVVDLGLSNGGEVIQKNINLFTPGTEKVTAVQHGNGRDYWVVSHPWNSDTFYSYLVNCAGIAPVPVKTKIGYNHSGSVYRSIGQMKASPNGKYMALAICDLNNNRVEVFRFDNISGVLSEVKTLSYSGGSRPYGIEFSPDNSHFYVGDITRKKIDQYRMSSYANLAASKTEIGTMGIAPGSLQVAPNGKIYISQWGGQYLSAVNQPNQNGAACGFQENALHLAGRTCELGLPSFIQSYFDPNAHETSDFTYTVSCDSVFFRSLHSEAGIIRRWDFGDGTFSSDSTPVHIYADTGTYLVRLVVHNSLKNCDPSKRDTTEKTVAFFSFKVALGSDKMACHPGYTGTLSCNVDADNYTWSTGETTKTINVLPNVRRYWLHAWKNGCPSADTVDVYGQFGNNSIFDADSMSYCVGDSLVLAADTADALFIWSTGMNTASIVATSSGWYKLTQKAGDCLYSDSVWVEEKLKPSVSFQGDTVFCTGETVNLTVTGATTYKWIPSDYLSSDVASNQVFVAEESITYEVRGGDENCYGKVTIPLVVKDPPPDFTITGDRCFVPGMQLKAPEGNWDILWSTSDTTQVIFPFDTGFYFLTLSNECGQAFDTLQLAMSNASDCKFYIPNAFRPASEVNGTFPFVSGSGYGLETFRSCTISYYRLVIFTRWGEVIYESDDLNKPWDGRLKDGTPAESAVYGYLIEAKYQSDCSDYTGMVESHKGNVTLLR